MPLPIVIEPPEETKVTSNATSDIAGRTNLQRDAVVRAWHILLPAETQSKFAPIIATLLLRPVV